MGRMDGKVVLVTGGSVGMGRSHSELLASEGAMVYVADIDVEQGMATEASIKKNGHKSKFLKLDVTCENNWSEVVKNIVDESGRIDVLVNNAGILILKPIQDTTIDEWDKTFNVNVKGMFIGTKAVIPFMKDNGGGNVINISSIYGLVGAPCAAAYETSKGAVRMFTKACAVDLANFNIRVNSVHPGVIETPMTKGLLSTPESTAAVLGPTLLRRPVKPIEVSQAILFLASDESSFVHGTELVVDGGYTAN